MELPIEDLQRTQLDRFHNILSHLHAGILLVGEDWRVEFANQAFCDLFELNLAPEELRGLTSSEVIRKIRHVYADPVAAVERIYHIIERGMPVRVEEVALRNGRTCLRDYIPLFLEGRRCGRLWHHQDITERKRAELELWKSNEEIALNHQIANIILTAHEEQVCGELLDLILQQVESPIGYLGYLDDRGDLVCPSMTKAIWDQCRIPGKEVRFSRDCWGGLWGRSLLGKTTLTANRDLAPPDGHLPLHRALVTPILLQGEVIGQIAVANKASDYTSEDQERMESIAEYIAPLLHSRLLRQKQRAERRAAEAALRRSEDKYRGLAASIPGMVFQFVLHPDGSYALPYVNERIMEYAAIPAEAAMAEPSLIFGPIHPEDRQLIQEAIQLSARTLQTLAVEHRIMDAHGEVRWFRVDSNPQRLPNGDILWNGVSMDITSRKRAEAEILDQKRLLEEQARHLEEINTALKVLLDRREYEKRKLVEEMHANMQQLILPYLQKARSRVSASEGKTLLEIAESNLNLLAADLLRMLPAGSTGLTPTEVRVADLVRHGKSNKEIAELLAVSSNAVSFHRKNIRRKLGLKGEKVNLQSFLRSSLQSMVG